MGKKKESDAENLKLQQENARLAREIAIEEQVAQRWQALAGIFHDTLWNALRRYDPPYYEKLQKHMQEKQMRDGEAMQLNPKEADAPVRPQPENQILRRENARLAQMLAEQTKRHERWERTAVRFHDTLWQVLLKYEPDTYGAICPAQAKEAEPDFTNLPEIGEDTE